MNNKAILIAALTGAFIWTGCQIAEEEMPMAETGILTVLAERNDGSQTKGLAIDGEEATTTLLKSIWKTGEEVKVYLGSNCIGTLTATPDGQDPHKATLTGEINTTGITPNTTTLTLLTPRENWDYTGQNGTLLLTDDPTGSIEKKYHYTMAAPVMVTGVSGNNITTENARFANQQSIYRLSFRYVVQDTRTPITAKTITINSANGHLIQTQTPGGATTEGPITLTLATPTADPIFVALRNTDETNTEALTLTVIDNQGITYRGTKQIPAQYKPNGTFVSAKNAPLTQRLQIDLDNTPSISVDTML